MKNIALLFLLLTLACTGSVYENSEIYSKDQSSIINGHKASVEDFPSIGALVTNEGTNQVCTVTLIKKDLALTAAHCVEHGLNGYHYVLHGYDAVLEDPCKECVYEIEDNAIHPDYSKQEEDWHDIAIILLKEEIDVEPSNIMDPDLFKLVVQEGDLVTIAGYGIYDYNGPWSNYESGELHAAEVPFGGYHSENEVYIGETVPGTPNACYGDSGGPVYVTYEDQVFVTGVANRLAEQIDNHYECGVKLVYTLPGKYHNWIEDTYIEMKLAAQENKEEESKETDPPIIPGLEWANEEIPILKPGGGCNMSNSNTGYGGLLLLLIGAGLAVRRKCIM